MYEPDPLENTTEKRAERVWLRGLKGPWIIAPIVVLLALLAGTAAYVAVSDEDPAPVTVDEDVPAAADDEPAEEVAASNEFTDPASFVGENVNLSGTISEVPNTNSFRVKNDDGDTLLVVYSGLPVVKDNLLVYVTGTMVEFDRAVVDKQLGAELPDLVYEQPDEYAVVASNVQKMGLASEKVALKDSKRSNGANAAVTSDAAPTAASVSAGAPVTSAPATSAPPASGSGSSGSGTSPTGSSGGGGSGGGDSKDGSGNGSGGGVAASAAPKLTYKGRDDSGQYTDLATFKAKLTEGGDPVSGAKVTFELKNADGSSSYAATTDRDGVVKTREQLRLAPGEYRLIARYRNGGDPVSDETTFTIAREDTALVLTVEAHDDGSGEGQDKADRLTAILSQTDGDGGIGNRTVQFYADGELIGSATTDGGGLAAIDVPTKYKNGQATFEARFAGDDYFLSATDSTA